MMGCCDTLDDGRGSFGGPKLRDVEFWRPGYAPFGIIIAGKRAGPLPFYATIT